MRSTSRRRRSIISNTRSPSVRPAKPVSSKNRPARSESECRQMVDVFKQAGVPLYVSYYRRYLAKFRKVKQIVAQRRTRRDRCDSLPHGEAASRVAVARRTRRSAAAAISTISPVTFSICSTTGSARSNCSAARRPTRSRFRSAEDAVALTFRTAGGALGNATWNFASATSVDELIIEGTFGSLRLAAMSRSGSLRMTLTPEAAVRASRSITHRVVTIVKRHAELRDAPSLSLRRRSSSRIDRCSNTSSRNCAPARPPARPDPALRTSAIMNKALDEYYGGRDDDVLERTPTRWQEPAQSGRAHESQRATAYRLSPEQVEFFEDERLSRAAEVRRRLASASSCR